MRRGRGRAASLNISVRHVQKSSAPSGASRSARPRSPRWKACEWALTIAGDERHHAPHPTPATAHGHLGIFEIDVPRPGAWLTPVRLRTSNMAAGTRSAITPASWPAKHTTSGGADPSTSAAASRSRSRSSGENPRPLERDATANSRRERRLDRAASRAQASASSRPGLDERASIHSRTREAIVVGAFGSASRPGGGHGQRRARSRQLLGGDDQPRRAEQRVPALVARRCARHGRRGRRPRPRAASGWPAS